MRLWGKCCAADARALPLHLHRAPFRGSQPSSTAATATATATVAAAKGRKRMLPS
ncbi:hypothetical protein BVRB_5g101780 [Beta vulgaris subsp. vulgaris]|nr:hypothetical protein BVRB_5g101780 [Beta vulgaris subsp. vulgaris]